jgi:MFS family permease
MKPLPPSQWLAWLPQLSHEIWILALGRLLSQTGSGFTLFYAPIFFVNQVGLSATQVGLGLGSASLSGVVGRFLGGSFADSQFWGRRRTLLLATVISAIASFVLAASGNFLVFVLGNLLMGLGMGLYWPATESMVADLTRPDQRNEAYALNRLGDNLGLGLGVVLGGLLIGATGAFRALFVIDGLSFLIFWAIIFWAIAETNQETSHPPALKGWKQALQDQQLLIFVAVNILFTTYIVQVSSTLPLYLTNFVPTGTQKGFSPITISALFTWHLAFSVICQLPIARWLNRFSRPQSLMLSAAVWAMGFLCIWATGVWPVGQLIWAILSMAVLGLATIAYLPSASSVVAELAPPTLRGVYLAINSQCWAIGYLIGPPLGGWALDQSATIAHGFWLALALTVLPAILILRHLEPPRRQSS